MLSFTMVFLPQTRAAYVWAWGTPAGNGDYGQLVVPANLTNVTAVAAGAIHAAALKTDGTVVCWGNSTYSSVPPGLSNVVGISACYYGTLALRADGKVVAWGQTDPFGHPEWPNLVPAGLSGVIAVSACFGNCLALKSDGTVTSWGYDTADAPPDLTNAVAIAAGQFFGVALRANGTVTAWGQGPFGSPLIVPADWTNVVAVSAGNYHALALLGNGTVRALGYFEGTNVPPSLTNAVAIAAGIATSAAITSDGTVVCWGQLAGPPSGVVAKQISLSDFGNWCLALATAPQPKVFINFVGPLNQTAAAGSQAFFSVSATGPPPLSYQWYFGTNIVAGATNQWLALNNVQPSQAGTYTVVVSIPGESETSQPVNLTVAPFLNVNMAPVITLSGGVGWTYRIEYMNSVGPTNAWAELATVTLTNSTQFYCDLSAIGQPKRIYRLLQGP